MLSSQTEDPAPAPGQAPAPEDGPEGWLRQCWIEGITATWGARLKTLGLQAARAGGDADLRAGLQAFAAVAAMGRGDYDLADQLLGPPPEEGSPSVLLIDQAARLYRACGDAERDPERAVAAMAALNEARARLQRSGEVSPEAATARGYAGLMLGEALLMVGDVGAARHQLELVVEEGQAPPALLTAVRCVLGGIEQAVGRPDLAIGHLQAAVRGAQGLAAEEGLSRLLLCGVMLSTDVRYGLALFDEYLARQRGKVPEGQGTVARLFRLLQMLVGVMREGPGAAMMLTLPMRVELRDLLRFLQGRHYSAGWFLLLTGLCAGALRGAGDPCEAYSVLIHAAATLRCRRMDGAAELCDRQIEMLRATLGVDQFEALLTEARHRRQLFLSYLGNRGQG